MTQTTFSGLCAGVASLAVALAINAGFAPAEPTATRPAAAQTALRAPLPAPRPAPAAALADSKPMAMAMPERMATLFR